MVKSLNTRCTELIPNAKLSELTQLREQFQKLQKLLTSKQEELESQISKKYNKLIESIKRRATNVLTKKLIVERNYHHLEVALKVVPLPILSCEESLLSGILLANSALIDIVKAQDAQITPDDRPGDVLSISCLQTDDAATDELLRALRQSESARAELL